MAGNSQRRGATRKVGSKKGATTGTGGKGRKALEGRGPTPKAEDRPYHVAAKRKAASEQTKTGKPAQHGGRSTSGAGKPAQRGGRPASGAGAGKPRHATRPRDKGPETVAGRNAVVEALRAGVPCDGVWVGHRVEADDRIREIRRIAAERGLPLMEVTTAELDRMTGLMVHQGVAIAVRPYRYAELGGILARADRAGEPALVIALDGVTDPRNLGAVLRSAGAFGAHGVVLPERRAAGVTAAAWKVSAGAAARVPVARVTNLVRALGELRDAGCFVVGLDAGGSTSVADLHLATGPVVLVVGSEGKGLGRLVRATCDIVAGIPIRAETESLNAGVAAGIGLYEVARLRSLG
jgi:23S rRNA (guanosine2251-2'-O)-methyltransferase